MTASPAIELRKELVDPPAPSSAAMKVSPAGISQARFDQYRLIRDEIAHEDNLMSNRLNWFTASQSFLLTALAIAHQGGTTMPNRFNDYLFPLAPIVAICSCVLILAGVVAGIIATRRWLRLLEGSFDQSDFIPRIKAEYAISLVGWSAPTLLPAIFLAAWIFVLWRGL